MDVSPLLAGVVLNKVVEKATSWSLIRGVLGIVAVVVGYAARYGGKQILGICCCIVRSSCSLSILVVENDV